MELRYLKARIGKPRTPGSTKPSDRQLNEVEAAHLQNSLAAAFAVAGEAMRDADNPGDTMDGDVERRVAIVCDWIRRHNGRAPDQKSENAEVGSKRKAPTPAPTCYLNCFFNNFLSRQGGQEPFFWCHGMPWHAMACHGTVSYTHLTLPTKRIV